MNKSVTRLYRFYNYNVGQRGQPFAMCDRCKKDYSSPDGCVIEKIADKTDWSCDCATEQEVSGE